MNLTLLPCMALVAFSAQAQDARVHQTDKYGVQRQQAFVVKRDRVYQTDKYGNQRQQTHVIKGSKVYQTDKYGNIQYSKPVLVIK